MMMTLTEKQDLQVKKFITAPFMTLSVLKKIAEKTEKAKKYKTFSITIYIKIFFPK